MIADLLLIARLKGAVLWSENGQLRYRAPKGALTDEEIEGLRSNRGPIISLLGKTGAKPGVEPDPLLRRAPLAYSQMAHWNFYQLHERPSLGLVSSAIRLRGLLDVDALRTSIAEIVRRHDALRTRVVVCDGIPVQEVTESVDCDLEIDDLTHLPEGLRNTHAYHLVESYILGPIHVARDRLFRTHLLRLSSHEHILIVVMEHMISDGSSKNLLLRELFAAYEQVVARGEVSLPGKPLQFSEYATSQRNGHKSWMERHGTYWAERLNGCRRLRFPEAKRFRSEAVGGLGDVPFKISKELKADLREWCRQRKTTLVMSVFTAYVALVLRWCNASEGVFLYETDGRVRPELESSVGYFAFPLYLRVELLENDRITDLLARVTNEYCNAYEHADFSYMESLVPRPDFTRNSCFNWVGPGYNMDEPNGDRSEDSIQRFHITLESRILTGIDRDSEPYALFHETAEEILGWVQYSVGRYSADTMGAFAQNLINFIKTFLYQPNIRVKDILIDDTTPPIEKELRYVGAGGG